MSRAVLGPEQVAAAGHDLVIGVRAGDSHRFTPVWAVVVEGRVYIRSWGLSERSWFPALQKGTTGAAQIGGAEVPVRGLVTRSERVRDKVDEAYRRKYHTPSSARYVDDLTSPKSRATTTELVPLDASANPNG